MSGKKKQLVIRADEWRKEHRGKEVPAKNGWYKVLIWKEVTIFDENGDAVGRKKKLSNDTWLYRGGWYGADANFYDETPRYRPHPVWWTEKEMTDDEPLQEVQPKGFEAITERMLSDWHDEYVRAYKLYISAWKERDCLQKIQTLETELKKGYLSCLIDNPDAVIESIRNEVRGWH